MTKQTAILNLLKKHKRGLSQLDLYKIGGPAFTTRLGAYIFELRENGHKINSVRQHKGNVSWVNYVYVKGPANAGK